MASEQTEWNQSRKGKRIIEMRVATYASCTQQEQMNELVNEIDKYKRDMCALQEIRWPRKAAVIKNKHMILYSGHKCDKHESGTKLYISTHIIGNLLILSP